MIRGGKLALSIVVPTAVVPTVAAQQSSTQKTPNIVVILCDDIGFSDLGCYGGEIETPVLDRMASNGVRLTEMYNSARSCPSRACIMTGLYPHQVGLGHMTGHNKWEEDGYNGFRTEGNVTFAEVLRSAGYFTAMSGKWHLGNSTPVQRGFDEYFGLLGGFDSFWNIKKYTRLPKGRPERTYADGEFYATNAITDYAIDFATQAKDENKPLLLYLAYNAAHFPLHAPKDMIDKYYQRYLQGWDAIREARCKRVAELGLLEGMPDMPSRGDVPESMRVMETYPIPAWDALSAEQQADLARRMAIYAAMIDIMDANIGRFIDALKANGQLDNTFIIFMADNGACAEWHEFGFDGGTGIKYHTHVGAELETMGQPGTYHHYGTGWANVCNTPLSQYKHHMHEGGISTPTVVWWGDNLKHGQINRQPCHFIDIMATLVDLSKATYPTEKNGTAVQPMEGISLIGMLKGGKLPKRCLFGEHEDNRMVRQGDWKLVSAYHHQGKWELYNIKEDRTEQHNVIDANQKRAAKMKAEYYAWAERCHVKSFAELWNKYGNYGRKFTVYPDD